MYCSNSLNLSPILTQDYFTTIIGQKRCTFKNLEEIMKNLEEIFKTRKIFF